MCQQALDLLFSMPELHGLSLTVVDIATDSALIDQYGQRLPVLRINDAELDWPFDAQMVKEAISSTP